MNEEKLQELESMMRGELLLGDNEVLHWLRKDVPCLIAEIRRLRGVFLTITAPDATSGGYQPTHGGLDPSKPPRGGSGLARKQS